METIAICVVAFFVVAFVVGTLWARTESYRDNQRFKRELRLRALGRQRGDLLG